MSKPENLSTYHRAETIWLLSVCRMSIKPITKTQSFLIWDFVLFRSSEKLLLIILNLVDKIFHKKRSSREIIKSVLVFPGKTSESYWSMLCLKLTNKLWLNQLPSEFMRLTTTSPLLNQWNSILKINGMWIDYVEGFKLSTEPMLF